MLSARILAAAAAALLAMGLKALPLVSSTESVLSAKDVAGGGDATSSLDLPRLRRVRSTVGGGGGGGGGSTATSQQQEEKHRYPLLGHGFEQTIVEEERDEGEGGGGVQPLIIGGNRASADDYRFYVQCNGCGATLIAPDMILSAAHCAKKIRRNSKVLVSAFKDWDPDTSGARFHLVEKTEKNPNYNDNEEYDFMVAKLKTPVENPVLVKLNRNVNVPQAAERLKVVGLGQIEDGEYPTYLQEVHVRVLTDSRCRSSYPDGWVTDSMFCAYGRDKDACYGDSGGPILDSNNFQVGVTSWAIGCAQKEYPGVYARMSSGIDWIEEMIDQWSDYPRNIYETEGLINSNVSVGGENATLYPLV